MDVAACAVRARPAPARPDSAGSAARPASAPAPSGVAPRSRSTAHRRHRQLARAAPTRAGPSGPPAAPTPSRAGRTARPSRGRGRPPAAAGASIRRLRGCPGPAAATPGWRWPRRSPGPARGMPSSAPACTIAVALASSRGPNPSSGCPGAHPSGAQAIPAEAPEVAGVELPIATTSSTTASSAASAAAAAPAIPARPIRRPTCVTCVRAPAAPGSPREQSAATPCPQHGRRTADDCDRFRFRRFPAAIRVSRDGQPRSSSGRYGPTGLTPACQTAALPARPVATR